MARPGLFARPGEADFQGQPSPDPWGKFLPEIVKAIVIAVAVYFATSAARQPETTAATLHDHDKRLAMMEQSIGTMKDDLREIKRAVTKR